jgi:epoxide hydrolase-like predicted phosphatase
MYKHIIFDFGGVFLDLGGKHTGVPKDLAKIFNISEQKASEIWKDNKERLLTGQETPQDFLVSMNTKLDLRLNIAKAYAEWKSYNTTEKEQINWDLLDYVRQLKKKYKIHMLTDTIDLDRSSDKWINEVDSHFENVFKSYKEKLKKPDKKAFLNALTKIDANPEECVFVDDFQPNITVANELGIKGILFTNLQTLKSDFKKLGI